MRILVAEDSPTTTMLLQGYLAQWGHEMVSCSNGAEAWEILQQPENMLSKLSTNMGRNIATIRELFRIR